MRYERTYSRAIRIGDQGGLEQTRLGYTRFSLGNHPLIILSLMIVATLPWISSPNLSNEPAKSPAPESSPIRALAVAFTPDGGTIATSHPDGGVEFRNRDDVGRIARFLPLRNLAWAMAFSPDGRLLALAGAESEIVLCDLEPGGPVRHVRMPIDQITAVAFSPDARTLAVASKRHNEIIVWDLSAGRCGRSCRAIHFRSSASPSRRIVDRSSPSRGIIR